MKGLDIFLAHGCPWGLGFEWQGQDIGDRPLRQLIDEIEPRFMFCGHAHLYKERIYNSRMRVISLAEFKQEYYLLDTLTNELTRIPTNH